MQFNHFKGARIKCKKRKGYGEGEFIDYAIRNSVLVFSSDVLIKANGRLKMPSIKVGPNIVIFTFITDILIRDAI